MSHSMTLEGYAACQGKDVKGSAGACVVMTPTLAEALDNLIDVIRLEVEQLHPEDPVTQALKRVKALHNFEQVRLDGQAAARPAEGQGEGES